MPTNLTDALISAKPVSAIVRTGIVTDWDPTFVQVNVGGTEIQAAYLDWYQPPIQGDLVAVVQQDSSWLVLGRYAGAGFNNVLNPSFEDSAPASSIPLNWAQFVTITGGSPLPAVISVVADDNAPQAGQVVNMASNGTANTVVLTSNAISVQPGEMYFLSVYAANFGFTPGGGVTNPPHQAQIMACWFTNDTETFPSATLANDYTMVDRRVNLRTSPPYTFLSGAVQVPAAMPVSGGVMRVGLRTDFIGTDTSTMRYDYVTARRMT